ncbi:DUF4371 domain-containing protein, partial [Aphis craccivora]
MFATTGTENEVVNSNTTVEVYRRRVAYMPIKIDSIFQKFTHGPWKAQLNVLLKWIFFMKVNISFFNNTFFSKYVPLWMF